MKVGIYRRTHKDDPCEHGIFGIAECMGEQRENRATKCCAILGIGTQGDIRGKLTYVGIGPKDELGKKDRHGNPLITFDNFCLMDENGPDLCKCACKLYKHIFIDRRFPRGICYSISDSVPGEVREDIERLVKEYKHCPPSDPKACKDLEAMGRGRACRPDSGRSKHNSTCRSNANC